MAFGTRGSPVLIMVDRALKASISHSWYAAGSSFSAEMTLDCESPPRPQPVTPMMILYDTGDEAVLLAYGSRSTCHTGSIEPML